MATRSVGPNCDILQRFLLFFDRILRCVVGGFTVRRVHLDAKGVATLVELVADGVVPLLASLLTPALLRCQRHCSVAGGGVPLLTALSRCFVRC